MGIEPIPVGTYSAECTRAVSGFGMSAQSTIQETLSIEISQCGATLQYHLRRLPLGLGGAAAQWMVLHETYSMSGSWVDGILMMECIGASGGFLAAGTIARLAILNTADTDLDTKLILRGVLAPAASDLVNSDSEVVVTKEDPL